MKYITVHEAAVKMGLSERSIRNYCATGRIEGAYLNGKNWCIPANVEKPVRKEYPIKRKGTLAEILKEEMQHGISGGIYHGVQINLTYNSNHIEGSRLSKDQTRYIFETNTIGLEKDNHLKVDDIIETVNHFRCIDIIIETSGKPISEKYIKVLHKRLKTGTSDERTDWIKVGDYKLVANEVGGKDTVSPKRVPKEMEKLFKWYEGLNNITFEDIVEFHYRFESIHPFQDGNGRVGRLIMFKECLRNNITPFIIDESIKMLYYQGLQKWKQQHGYLLETCRLSQDAFKEYLDKFGINHD